MIIIFGKYCFGVMDMESNEKGAYRTKQREIILDYLKKCQDGHVTIDEVTDHLKNEGNKVGRTTIYRYMEKLADEGFLRKYYIEEGVGACYQYQGDDVSCRNHFHLKCVKCGKLFHVSCDFLQQIEEHVYEHHHFLVDNSKTVLYGICEDCQAGMGDEPNTHHGECGCGHEHDDDNKTGRGE